MAKSAFLNDVDLRRMSLHLAEFIMPRRDIKMPQVNGDNLLHQQLVKRTIETLQAQDDAFAIEYETASDADLIAYVRQCVDVSYTPAPCEVVGGAYIAQRFGNSTSFRNEKRSGRPRLTLLPSARTAIRPAPPPMPQRRMRKNDGCIDRYTRHQFYRVLRASVCVCRRASISIRPSSRSFHQYGRRNRRAFSSQT